MVYLIADATALSCAALCEYFRRLKKNTKQSSTLSLSLSPSLSVHIHRENTLKVTAVRWSRENQWRFCLLSLSPSLQVFVFLFSLSLSVISNCKLLLLSATRTQEKDIYDILLFHFFVSVLSLSCDASKKHEFLSFFLLLSARFTFTQFTYTNKLLQRHREHLVCSFIFHETLRYVTV